MITYRAAIDVPAELARFVCRLLAAGASCPGRWRGTSSQPGPHILWRASASCTLKPVKVLADGTYGPKRSSRLKCAASGGTSPHPGTPDSG